MDLGLAGKVALVTGASGGIGEGVARALAAEGARVVAHAHTGFDRLGPWCGPAGIDTVQADLCDPAAVDAAFDAVRSRHGRIDVVAANAGRWPEPELRIHETPVEDLRKALDDNLWSAVLTARAFLRTLAASGPGPDGAALVFTGSTAGRFGEHGHVAYATAKAGLHGLVLTLKNEIVHLDPQGRVNLVQPGWTATPAVAHALTAETVARVTRTMALRRVAAVEDVARAVVFLASPRAARHLTGQVITVAGGMEGRTLW